MKKRETEELGGREGGSKEECDEWGRIWELARSPRYKLFNRYTRGSVILNGYHLADTIAHLISVQEYPDW